MAADPHWKYMNPRTIESTFINTISSTQHSKGIVFRSRLLEGNETGRVGGTDTGTTVLDGLVGDGELSQVVANHLGLDLDLVELLAGVDADNAADHLGDNDHVTQVRLDKVGLLVGLGLLLGLAELLDQTHGLALQATVEAAAGAGVDDITELLRGEVKEPINNSQMCDLLVIHSRMPCKSAWKLTP